MVMGGAIIKAECKKCRWRTELGVSLRDSHWDVCWAGNGSQSGQGAIELGFPGPALGQKPS